MAQQQQPPPLPPPINSILNNPQAALGQDSNSPMLPGDNQDVDEISHALDRMLLDDNYSIELLIRHAQQKNMSLNELRDQLVNHKQQLNQTSLELFNNSYDRFYKLSHIITCLAEPIQRVVNPLQTFRNQLGDLCQRHDTYLSEINNKLTQLEDTNRNKQLAIKLIQLIKKQNRIFQSIQANELLKRDVSVQGIVREPMDINRKVECDTIERVSVELFYLYCEISAIQSTSDELIPIKNSLGSDVMKQRDLLGAWLCELFKESIQAQNKELIEFVLRTYKQIGDSRELECVWRDLIVKPYLNLTSDDKLLHEMQQTYELLKQFLRVHIDLIDAAFVPRLFWGQITEFLDRPEIEALYASTEIESFKERYMLTKEFMHLQNNFLCDDNTSPAGLKSNEATANIARIMSKFDLNGYFNQKTAQLVKILDDELAGQALSKFHVTKVILESGFSSGVIDDGLDDFKLKICAHLFKLIVRCWSKDVYIDELDDKVSNLINTLLRRFADWLSKLRLSNFKITETSANESPGTGDFFANQDAIMRQLVDDCKRLEESTNQLESKMPCASAIRKSAINSGFEAVRIGLKNVESLQQLLESCM